MFNGKHIIIFLTLIAFLGGGFLLWVQQKGGFAAFSLKPEFVFSPSQASPAPDYTKKSAWSAYPRKESAANQRPKGETPASKDRREAVDVFFVHPTTLLSNEHWTDDPARDDTVLNVGVAAPQMSVFNNCCQIYAPRYRQATLWSFMGNEPSGFRALEFSYADVRRAFRRFVRVSGNRPFILAGHSQGSLHALRLLEEEIIPNKRLKARMIVAYLIGYAIPTELGFDIQPCANATDTRCYVNWNSVTEDYQGDFWRKTGRLWLHGGWQTIADKKLTCVNPLSWRLGGGLVSKNFHPGGLITSLSQKELPALTKELVSARCSDDGLLYISRPEGDFESAMVDGGDFHVYDYALFYQPLRLNVGQRVSAFFKKSSRN